MDSKAAAAAAMDVTELKKKVRRKLKKTLGRKPTKEEVAALLEKRIAKLAKASGGKAAGDGDGAAKGTAKKAKKNDKEKKGKKSDKAERKRKREPNDQESNGAAAKRVNGYTEHPDVAAMSAAEVAKFRDSNALSVTGSSTEYKPILEFDQVELPPTLRKFCSRYAKPTSIQSQVWPIILSGADCIGIASTGSGKTLGFGLPGLLHVAKTGRASPKHPAMLVVSPTRELAVQTAEVCEEAGSCMDPPIGSVCVFGGVAKGPQTSALRRGVHIVVATPGRLYDLMESSEVYLDQVTYLVLDEADRMLDLGFEREIKHFMSSASKPSRRTMMFSATWPLEVQQIGTGYMKSPVRVTVGERDRLVSNHNVKQHVYVMEQHDKEPKLFELLKRMGKTERVLIFGLYKKECARLEVTLQRRGFRDAAAIHGDLSQDRRTQILDGFKDGSIRVMVATDVAARGLDVRELKYVINFTFPLTVEDYVHRVGRTGRAGAKGEAHTFFTAQEKGLAGGLGNVLREAGMEVPQALMNFGQTTKRKTHKLWGALTATQEAMAGKTATKIVFD
mmetsp:Transcript_28636/g.75218  ORF Transcript_28636/g.75218 Transcript_28636/m.75218 type:complete len:560 (+) Transcript_28636:125-1804(+)|eukprot:CAMPEP_0182937788 /NCGR_PEP_ID=MMETSP0105_2-20130417/42737_1 /TAXON_ID=81532 ORGANISM="Acanthoeca-like sp., Strain 10tr" /NCGR_SAMPLE_ID=MMETSP0105_2 /ASSEMBLY_ACC=CAM_ASM_000205 /LENGTH=559 /DNA_ID=CAMNT_0025077029 /DNA_START=45 /DNA_END=1724 /DNA_ORIENTATION=-